MADVTYENLPVSVVRDEDQGMYRFGVTIDGAFIAFGARKLGGVDDDLRRARDANAEKAKAEQQAQEQRDAEARARVQQEAQEQQSPPPTGGSPSLPPEQ